MNLRGTYEEVLPASTSLNATVRAVRDRGLAKLASADLVWATIAFVILVSVVLPRQGQPVTGDA